jgi:hypothetical protein
MTAYVGLTATKTSIIDHLRPSSLKISRWTGRRLGVLRASCHLVRAERLRTVVIEEGVREKSQMGVADGHRADVSRVRTDGGAGATTPLEEAQSLAVRIDALLENALGQAPEASAFRMRLARAHALGLLDQLGELLSPVSGGVTPGLRSCIPREPESQLQPKTLRDQDDGQGKPSGTTLITDESVFSGAHLKRLGSSH